MRNGYLPQPTYDWTAERETPVVDDGTMSFFWRTHTLSVLFLFICGLIYVAAFEPISFDSEYNSKRGFVAVVVIFLLLGVTQCPNLPFKRPHPAFWRLIFCLTLVYELGLVYLLFQTVDDARQFMKHFDSSLGVPLPEKDYGGNCLIYDSNNTVDPFHNLWDKMDEMVISHFFGYWLKTLVFRDYWLCGITSILFELLEYSLEHQLPNFSECWWDHWILDALICNGSGIYVGMLTLRYLNMKSFYWRAMWKISTFRGKVKRVAQQFTPYSWMDFDWRPLQNFSRWVSVIGLTTVFLLAELNSFYLKFIFWLPPPHYLNCIRLVLFLLAGAVSMRETYQYLDDPFCKQFGSQSWVMLAIIITELLLVVKFGSEILTKPVPSRVIVFWVLALITLVLWTGWKFFAKPFFWACDHHISNQDHKNLSQFPSQRKLKKK